MSDQRCFNIKDHRSNNIDPTLRMKKIKSEIGFSTLHNIDTVLVPSVETMLNQRCTTLMQPFFNVAQCRFNVVSTLILHYLNVVSMWLQRQLKLHQNQSG